MCAAPPTDAEGTEDGAGGAPGGGVGPDAGGGEAVAAEAVEVFFAPFLRERAGVKPSASVEDLSDVGAS